jgi:hypothetical protein
MRAAAPPFHSSSTPALPTTPTLTSPRARLMRTGLLFLPIYLPSISPPSRSIAPAKPNPAGPHNSAKSQPGMSLRCSPAALSHSSTPQGDVTGLSGCPRGLGPDWPVLHSYVSSARPSLRDCPPYAIESHSHRNSTVLNTNHKRSLSCRFSPRSTTASLSTKQKRRNRASSPWPSRAARTAPPTIARNWHLPSYLVRTHESITQSHHSTN